MMIDIFGRIWDFPRNELCPECGQPDSCGDCSHDQLSYLEVINLNGGCCVQHPLPRGVRMLRKKFKPNQIVRHVSDPVRNHGVFIRYCDADEGEGMVRVEWRGQIRPETLKAADVRIVKICRDDSNL